MESIITIEFLKIQRLLIKIAIIMENIKRNTPIESAHPKESVCYLLYILGKIVPLSVVAIFAKLRLSPKANDN